MSQSKLTTLTKQLKKHRASLAKERDHLRDLSSEIALLTEKAEEAVDFLDDAIDSLSELL